MMRRREFASAGITAAALAAMEAAGLANERKPDPESSAASLFEKCGQACSDCQRICEACATHCAKLLSKGDEHHLQTLGTCRDCATLCSAASHIVAREGNFSDLVCRACEEACGRCAANCELHGRGDAIMSRCAEECRKCETACREMLAQALPGRK
jgi:hypothetical protein